MANKLPVWGIDVGQCSLKALKIQAVGDQVQLLAFDVIEHPTILSQAEGEATKLMREAIEKFASRNDLRGCQVVVAVPGQQTLTRFAKMPPVEQKKIPDMVQYEAGQQIPFDMEEVVWDYHVFTEPNSPDVEVGVSSLIDTWILLRNSPPGEEGGRHLSVLKSRGMAHSSERRSFELTDRGPILLVEPQSSKTARGVRA